ncbi:MAG: translation initiation factor IF-2, partial [Candidatus Binatota bacterium]|nr:translation initiation factor IF-2 [Candidatus Binatota bacterium]
MGKTRVHLLAKELGIETKDLIAQLDKLGMRGRKAQSAMEEDEVARVRSALVAQEKPQVHIGEEKIIARVVKTEEEGQGSVESRETVVERRVRTNVIRRRTSRVEVAPPEGAVEARVAAPVEPEMIAESLVSAEPAAPEPTVVEETPVETAAEAPAPTEETAWIEPVVEAATPEVLPEKIVARPEPVAVAPVAEPRPAAPEPESMEALQRTAPRGARILGRIDLKQTPRVEPAPTPVLRRPAAGVTAAGAPGTAPLEPGAGDGDKPKAGRHKKRVVKKQDVIESREKEVRGGRGIPRKKRVMPGKEVRRTEITVPRASKRVIKISEVISVGDLSREMGIKAGEVIKKLMGMGMMATINQVLDADTATLIASEFEFQVENVAFNADSALEETPVGAEEEEAALQARPPVVTIMGHVDHGKTSLLDAIRSTHVTAQEHGGITQHIGAYHVQVDGRSVTFLDTPGHEAFTAMRARGAKVTDIVVLVVAADDGVMPQTIEAINHARAAEVPIIVAVNKMDRPDANLEKVKKGLSEYGLAAEDWGGDTVFAPVSAKTQEGIPHLLEMLQLQSDILELKANPEKLARGTIVEAKLDRGRGPVATVLVQEGTLHVGDAFVCGVFYGKVRAMIDDHGQKVDVAPPSFPVEILGLQGVPLAGDSFVAVADEAKARQVAEFRHSKQRETELVKSSKVSLDDLYSQIKAGDVKELRVVLKADVQGSVEAVSEALTRMSTGDVKLKVLHGSVGGITESDILLAAASNAIVIGFNVRPESKGAA